MPEPTVAYSTHCPACHTANAPGSKRCGLCKRLLPGVAVSNLKAREYTSRRKPTTPPPPTPA
jgi:hypothetical protein